jgi:predicted Rossmann fold flavoprotein
MPTYDVVVLGAGAAGLFCAMRAGQRGLKVIVLDKAPQVGAKILISGGGRCNFTNLHIAADKYISENPPFCISALKSYTQHDFIALVQKHRIAYHEKTLGQLFCDGSAQQIVDMLLEECRAAQVEIRLNCQIAQVTKSDLFHIQTDQENIEARHCVLATGGLSIPKMGATGLSYDIARHFDVPVIETAPALVPLVFEGERLDFMRDLAGVSLTVDVACGKKKFREGMVFTHRGLSGPAILQISSYWRDGEPITIDLMPDVDVFSLLRAYRQARPKAELKTMLSEVLPQRLAQALVTGFFVNTQMNALSDKRLQEIAALVKGWVVKPSGTEGYAKAEVTRGGISTHALSSKTMEVKKVSNLYVIGEAVDVTGWLGGYNFQWAWSSGWAAGSAIKSL